MVAPDSQAKHACRQAAIPLTALFKNPEPPLKSAVKLGGTSMAEQVAL
jgi:hypothetical protein